MKILILDSVNEYGIGHQCARVFEKWGHIVEIINYRRYYSYKIFLTNKIMNERIIRKCRKIKPDFLLVIKGESILPGTIKKIKHDGVKTAAWNPDEPFGILLKFNKIKNIDEYDYYFSFDRKYIPKLREINSNSYHLPIGGDPYGFHKQQIKPEDRTYPYDVSIVGTLYENRVETLKLLLNLKTVAVGPGWDQVKDVNLQKHIIPKFPRGQEIVKFFNNSKINLNVYHPHPNAIVPNPRTFEIPASNSFQICQYFKEIENYFIPKKEIVFYKDEKDLTEKVQYYLSNEEERQKIQTAGFQKVLKEHTMEHRLKKMLEIMGISCADK